MKAARSRCPVSFQFHTVSVGGGGDITARPSGPKGDDKKGSEASRLRHDGAFQTQVHEERSLSPGAGHGTAPPWMIRFMGSAGCPPRHFSGVPPPRRRSQARPAPLRHAMQALGSRLAVSDDRHETSRMRCRNVNAARACGKPADNPVQSREIRAGKVRLDRSDRVQNQRVEAIHHRSLRRKTT